MPQRFSKSNIKRGIHGCPLWLKGNVRRQSDKGIVLTKYLGLACLSLAILSTLILNIVSSYSSSNIESNAEPVCDASTLANIDPASISISISSYPSSSSTGGNDPNLSLSIPQGGGIATGRHTVSVVSNSYAGYSVTVEGSGNTTDMSQTCQPQTLVLVLVVIMN